MLAVRQRATCTMYSQFRDPNQFCHAGASTKCRLVCAVLKRGEAGRGDEGVTPAGSFAGTEGPATALLSTAGPWVLWDAVCTTIAPTCGWALCAWGCRTLLVRRLVLQSYLKTILCPGHRLWGGIGMNMLYQTNVQFATQWIPVSCKEHACCNFIM